MILDARKIPQGTVLTCDVVVVGSGPAGIPAALRLAKGGVRVILLEAGGERYAAREQQHYAGEVADPAVHHPLDHYRVRQLGGGSNLWGGRCAPYDDIDFERRDWVPLSGWPFGNAELNPYYAQASEHLDLGEFSYEPQEAKPFPGMDWEQISDRAVWRYSLPTNMRTKYKRTLRASQAIQTMLHASCLELRTSDGGGSVAEAVVGTEPGKTISVRAKCFVLACGAIETARLLLVSHDRHPNGIGNTHDQVGRHYQSHLYGSLAMIAYRGDPRAVRHGFDRSRDGVYVQHMLKPEAAVQRDRRLLNFCAVLANGDFNDPSHGSGVLSSMFLAKWLMSRRLPVELAGRGLEQKHRVAVSGTSATAAHLWNVVRDAPSVDWLTKRILSARKLPGVSCYSPKGEYRLLYSAEQTPNPDSRITLAQSKDAFGYNRARADWRYSGADIDSIVANHAVIAQDAARASNGLLDCTIDTDIAAGARAAASVGSHHIGTARISTDPKHGVVDAHCRVHGIANLYVAGSATFPTSSCMSVTLLITAMALRVADTVTGRLAARHMS
jgi:choline dehydrogenase-like flavoprotein